MRGTGASVVGPLLEILAKLLQPTLLPMRFDMSSKLSPSTPGAPPFAESVFPLETHGFPGEANGVVVEKLDSRRRFRYSLQNVGSCFLCAAGSPKKRSMRKIESRILNTRTRDPLDTVDESQGIETLILTILWHGEISRVGDCAWLLELEEGRSLALSRSEPLFTSPDRVTEPRPLAEPRMSRQPIWLDPQGAGLKISSPETLPPVEVDGALVEGSRTLTAAELSRGVVLLVAGCVALFLERRPPALQRPPRYGLVGESAAMWRLRHQIEAMADLDLPVLIRGESGTGKELVAQAIQAHSKRRNGPFLALNMAAVPVSLAATELFGATKGAFSGADHTRAGFFKQADGGTLFLDEIGEAPREIQGLLLRVLESGEIQAVGAGRLERVDVRVIAATDADLEGQVQDGGFTNPLLQRLRGLEIHLPALQERIEDLGRLFRHFLREELRHLGEEDRLTYGGPFVSPYVSARMVARMARYRWPGNVRELRNEVRQLAVASRGADRLTTGTWLQRPPQQTDSVAQVPESPPQPSANQPKRATVLYRDPSSPREEELMQALLDHDWNIKATAETLGISRTSLYARIRENPSIRQANELEIEEIEDALQRCGDNLAAVAQALRVSKQGLKRQMNRLKIR